MKTAFSYGLFVYILQYCRLRISGCAFEKTFKTTSKTNRFLHVIKAQIYGNMNCFTNSFPDDFQRKRQLNPLAEKLILHQDV